MAYIQKGSCNTPDLIERRSTLFSRPYIPSHEAPCEGIYRCICGHEIIYPASEELPLCDDHTLPVPMAWRLVVSINDIPEDIDWPPKD
jgi:hypothetical protein